MTFTQRDFSNMRQDDRAIVCQRDIDLVLEKFEESKARNPSFYYVVHYVEDGCNAFT